MTQTTPSQGAQATSQPTYRPRRGPLPAAETAEARTAARLAELPSPASVSGVAAAWLAAGLAGRDDDFGPGCRYARGP